MTRGTPHNRLDEFSGRVYQTSTGLLADRALAALFPQLRSIVSPGTPMSLTTYQTAASRGDRTAPIPHEGRTR
jgi:hypothetical protein